MPAPAPRTTQRVLQLLSLFHSRSTWTAAELAERLGVTERTVRRDVERLRELGYPVDGTRGVGGGYRIGRGGRLPPLVLDDEEAIAVAVALRVAAGGVEGVGDAAIRALAKLDQVLPARLAATVHAFDEATDVAPQADKALAGVDRPTLMVASRAIRDRVRLRFGYSARDGSLSERDVEAYRIVAVGRRWYLLAWDLGREDWRTFRVDRMSGAKESTYRFAPRPAPDAVAYVMEAVRRGGYAVTATARYDVAAEVLRQRVPSSVGEVREISANPPVAELVASADDVDSLAWHLSWVARDLDAALTVIDPPEVRDALRRHGDRLHAEAARGC